MFHNTTNISDIYTIDFENPSKKKQKADNKFSICTEQVAASTINQSTTTYF